MFANLQEREKNILAIVSVLIVLLTIWFLFKPTLSEYIRLRKEIDMLKQEAIDPVLTKKKIQALNIELKQLGVEINDLRKQVPESDKRNFLIRDLEDLARENQIELLSFMPKDAVPVTMQGKEIDPRMKKYRAEQQSIEESHAKVLKTVINIDSKGKFANYKKFFEEILTYYRAVEVSDLIITRSGVASGMGQDKRFNPKSGKKDPLEAARNTDLSISFTLLAYTSLSDMDQQDIGSSSEKLADRRSL